MSPVVRECERLKLNYLILHTGQHYSYEMDKIFFEQLKLPNAKYNLDIGSGMPGEQTGKMLIGIEKVLMKEKPDLVLVEGDTNTVLAGALAATKLHIKLGHVEAGLRSYDRRMPEEINRVLTDHCSDYLFAPTENARQVLLDEGVPDEKIFVTGNTVVDAVRQNLSLSISKNENSLKNSLKKLREYFLVTAHRQENVDVKARFEGILKGLELVAAEFGLPVIYPIHPRARKMMSRFGLRLRAKAGEGTGEGAGAGEGTGEGAGEGTGEGTGDREGAGAGASGANGVKFIEPLDYLSFLQLESKARLVLTDSGGVQEESCVLGVPCVTLRENTERPETLEVGSNKLAGTSPENILKAAKEMLGRVGKKEEGKEKEGKGKEGKGKEKEGKGSNWRNPFGDGKSGSRIIEILLK